MTTKKIFPYAMLLCVCILVLWLAYYSHFAGADNTLTPSCTSFPSNLSLEESGSIESSSNDCWWLNSGALFSVQNGVGQTFMGSEDPHSKWATLYAVSNPEDTDNGLHPQNLFRLINRGQWQDVREEVFFHVNTYNLSSSQNRNMTNGVFLLGRYVNADNLYIGGIRVDGTAVIKRKFKGVYETLGTVSLANPSLYNRDNNPNLLPQNEWTGLGFEIKNRPDGGVALSLQLSYDEGKTWTTVLSVNDFETLSQDGKILYGSGHTGIRTDFMDILFKKYSIGLLSQNINNG